MRYMGGKHRIAKYFMPIVLSARKPGQVYVEPFVGGANTLIRVSGQRIAADANPYLIAMWKAVQAGWQPPDVVTEDEYNAVKADFDRYAPELVAFIAFGCTFGGGWFNTYARDNRGDDYVQQTKSALNRKRRALQGVTFIHATYDALSIPPRSLIYCDPPYAGTTGYMSAFDSAAFWQWADAMTDDGHTVFVSEYHAPAHWRCVWAKERTVNLTNLTPAQSAVERVFTRSEMAVVEYAPMATLAMF